ncbi:MAG: PSD1 and planctomycete cytochrome C domain-containing protein [Planctomycetaceae bacterium]
MAIVIRRPPPVPTLPPDPRPPRGPNAGGVSPPRAAALAVAAAWSLAAASHGAGPDFVRDIRPLLERSCARCHAGEAAESGLRLDVRSAAFAGGDGHGPGIVPGDPEASALVHAVRGDAGLERMPPADAGVPAFSADEVALVAAWIAAGAEWPAGADTGTVADRRDHWAFRPVVRPQPPGVADATWPRNDVDRFILARLEAEGLRPAAEADRTTWLRRVTFDLTGLPPSPEEIDAFLADTSPGAFERVVDRLLASPRHGERMATHWLDVVRYADTHGYEVNTERPNAWPYRDWVVAAFNAGMPYDRFVRRQLAGDTDGDDAATGFLVTAAVLLPGQIGADDVSKRAARQDALADVIVNVGEAFLGLSVGCARCHDHKFDPLTARDYYALQACVSGVLYEERELRGPEAEARRAEIARLRARLGEIAAARTAHAPRVGAGTPRPAVSARLNVDRIVPRRATRVRFTILATNSLEPCIYELEVIDTAGRNVAAAAAGATVRSSGDNVAPDRHELRFVNDGLYGNERSWMSSETGAGWVEVAFREPAEVDRIVWARDRNGVYADRTAIRYRIELADGPEGALERVADETDRLAPATAPAEGMPDGLTDAERAALAPLDAERDAALARIAELDRGLLAFAGRFVPPDPTRVLHRGDAEQPGDPVGPRSPAAFDGILGPLDLPADAPEAERRRALAEWIVAPGNPLAARVIANRIWQWHFGTGIVETSSDLGRAGAPPSHPELLDWLAAEIVDGGWSLARLHRLIVLSAAYRQGSVPNADGLARDAQDRLLWRYPARRLEAEAIRDSMLAVSGLLDRSMGGRGFDLFRSRGGLDGFVPVETFSGEGLKRMVYAHKVRMEKESVFGAFDCPDAGQTAARRRQSTTPIQALNLLNSPFTLQVAEAFAARVAGEAAAGDGDPVERQVRRAVRLAAGRDPSAAELADAAELVRGHGLVALCRVLVNTGDFVTLP